MPQDVSEVYSFGSDELVIWRYLDIPKLISMLRSQALWFARVDSLPNAHEGAPTEFGRYIRSEMGESLDDQLVVDALSEMHQSGRTRTFVSCWHLADAESMAMWQIYSGSGRGVAVKSSSGRLWRALENAPNPLGRDVKMGVVRYGTLETRPDLASNPLTAFMQKRSAFEFEHELRALYQLEHPQDDEGEAFAVDLATVIESVVVSPGTPRWIAEVVEAVVRSYGPAGTPVLMSSLDGPPTL